MLLSGEGGMAKLEGFKDGLKNLGIKDAKFLVYNGENILKGIEKKGYKDGGE